MLVDGNRVEWFLKFNESLYGFNKESANLFEILKTGLESRGCHQ